MDKYQETFKTWNKVASDYESKFMNLDLYHDTYTALIESIPSENVFILDIGCGPGNITKYLLKNNAGFKIKGIDVSESMVKLAAKNCTQAQFEVMDCREIDWINEKYDVIVCGFCIPYLSETDCSTLIMSCRQLLNNKGVLYLSFVEGSYQNSGFVSGSSGDRAFFYYHTLDSLQEKLTTASYERCETFEKTYNKADGTTEKHIVLLVRKL